MVENQIKTILVLDTSWLMEIGKKDYNVLMDLLKPPEVEIRIHNRVFKELDGLKNVEEKSLQARKVSQYLEEALNTYKERVQISDFGMKQPAEKFASALQSEVDAIVLTLAEMSEKENKNTVLLTTDRNQRILWGKDDKEIKNLFLKDKKCTSSFEYVLVALSFFVTLFFTIYISIKLHSGAFLGVILIIVLVIAFLKSLSREEEKIINSQQVDRDAKTKLKYDDFSFDLFLDDVEDDVIFDPAYNCLPENIYYNGKF